MLKNQACYLQPVCGNDSCRKLLRIGRIHGQLIFVNLQTEPGIRILGKCMWFGLV